MNGLSHRGIPLDTRPEELETDEIADALRSLPLADPPTGLFPAVMSEINRQQESELPVFQLSWIDFALTLFFAGMIGLVLLVAGNIPAQMRLNLTWQLQWLQVMRFDRFLWPALVLAAAASITASVVFAAAMLAGKARE